MVKTRAQREQGFTTPSPKSLSRVQVQEKANNDVTRSSRKSGKAVVEDSGRATGTGGGHSDGSSGTSRSRSDATPKMKKAGNELQRKTTKTVLEESDSETEVAQKKRKKSSSDSAEKAKKMKASSKELEREDDPHPQTSDEEECQSEASEPENGNLIVERTSELREEMPENEHEVETGSDTRTSPKGEKNLPNTGTKRREEARIDQVEDDWEEDDDDAPQDVSFSRSRKEALETISQALQDSRRSKERAKEWRRNQDQLLKLQKERKKISLQNSFLPQDFLTEVAKTTEQESTESGNTALNVQSRKGQHKVFDSDGEGEEGDIAAPFSADAPRVISGFQVQTVRQQQREAPPTSATALDFLHNQLYGSKVKRESVSKHLSKRQKRKGRPGVIFSTHKEQR